MIKWIGIIFCVFTVSCGLFEDEPIQIISKIDGQEYLADMEGGMSAKKAARMILEGKQDSISYQFKLAISDSLHTKDSVWRGRYFEALNSILPSLDSANIVYVAENAFAYFIHHPKELLDNLNGNAFDNSDHWTNLLSYQVRLKTEPADITSISIINRAHKYCENCTDETMELIIQYVEILDKYSEPLQFNEEVIPMISM